MRVLSVMECGHYGGCPLGMSCFDHLRACLRIVRDESRMNYCIGAGNWVTGNGVTGNEFGVWVMLSALLFVLS